MQYLGRATIRAGGLVFNTEKGAKLNLGGAKRNSVVTNYAVGYAEENAAAELECTIPLEKGGSLQVIRDMVDATLIFECDTGQVYVVNGAFVTDTLEVTDGEGGKISVKMAGEPAIEMA